MPWIRQGQCLQCGQCCRLINLLNASANKNTKVSDKRVVCIHLKENKDGGAICSIFGTDRRPLACSLHPSSPQSLTSDSCGYYFIWTEI